MKMPSVQLGIGFASGIVFALLGSVLWGPQREASVVSAGSAVRALQAALIARSQDILPGSLAAGSLPLGAPRCTQCSSCNGELLSKLCQQEFAQLGARSLSSLDESAYSSKAAESWYASIACPLHRSMWIVSTLTPDHPREGVIMERLTELTSHSSWGVMLVSVQHASAPSDSPVVSILGPNIAVMNVSSELLTTLPLEIGPMMLQQLNYRAASEWGRGDADASAAAYSTNSMLLNAHGRLHVALKMLPYLLAIKCGATAIFDTIDDDVGHFTVPLGTVNPWMVEVGRMGSSASRGEKR